MTSVSPSPLGANAGSVSSSGRWFLCFFDGDGYGRTARLQHNARKVVEAVLETLQRPCERRDLLRQEAAVLLHAVERAFGLLAGGAGR